MRTSFLSAILASACLVAAAPAIEPAKRELNLGGLLGPLGNTVGSAPGVGGIAGGAQAITAEAFKGGDIFLNGPGDAAGRILAGDPMGAVTSTVGGAGTIIGQLPGDAAKIAGSFLGGK